MQQPNSLKNLDRIPIEIHIFMMIKFWIVHLYDLHNTGAVVGIRESLLEFYTQVMQSIVYNCFIKLVIN